MHQIRSVPNVPGFAQPALTRTLGVDSDVLIALQIRTAQQEVQNLFAARMVRSDICPTLAEVAQTGHGAMTDKHSHVKWDFTLLVNHKIGPILMHAIGARID